MKRTHFRALVILLAIVLVGAVFFDDLAGAYRTLRFYLGVPTAAQTQVMEFAREHDVSYGEYPTSLIDLLERNPETETFVLEYPLWQGGSYDLSDFDRSQGVPLFIQWDQRWGYTKYGSDVIGITGCGPTCLAMVGYYLTGDSWYTPENVASFSWKNGYYSAGNGSSWTLISQGAVELGLDVTEIPLVKKRMTDNLEVGNPIICAMGPGDFTTSGHYIVLVGMEDGQFQVNDPNSYANSSRLWSYEEIEGQIRNLWVIRYFG